MQKLIKSTTFAVLTTFAAAGVYAQEEKSENSAVQDAWLDGKLTTVIVLNEHLNPLQIETDVVNGVAIVTGKVDSEIQKDLLTELAYGVEGIREVDNKLVVAESKSVGERAQEVSANLLDTSISTAISTKLLLNSGIDSSGIDVETNDKEVTLVGEVPSEIQRDLVEQIAMNTFDVEEVTNNLSIVQ